MQKIVKRKSGINYLYHSINYLFLQPYTFIYASANPKCY